MLLMSSADFFFSKLTFSKIYSGALLYIFRVSKNASEIVVCLSHLLHIFANINNKSKYRGIEAYSVDPDQTAPIGAV